ncbi:MAG TPA: FlgD immunoglobulin-like domain containing protein, partial [Candidatus Krumholzibacteria bacterium]
PRDGAVAQLTTLTFDWSAFDPDGEGVSYSFYLGTANPPAFWASETTTSKQLTLDPDTQYFWKIIYRDAFGANTSGPVWRFHTDVAHPSLLTGPSPADLSVDQAVNLILDWDAFEPDGDPMHFDVYFGTTATPAKVASFQTGTTFDASGAFAILPSTTYYWRVIARTNNGSTTGPLWSFVTKPNSPPSMAFGQTPVNGGIAHNPPWMNWLATDVDAPEQSLRYNVYFGTTNPPPLVEAGRHAPNYSPGLLQEGTPYFWSITVSDPFASTPGPVWSFMVDDSVLTGVGDAPVVTTLGRNFPNPFNPQTIIPYGVPDSRGPVHVKLIVYDALGRTVRVLVDELQSSGSRDVIWRGDDDRGAKVSSGVYYCVLQVGSDRRTQKMVLLK